MMDLGVFFVMKENYYDKSHDNHDPHIEPEGGYVVGPESLGATVEGCISVCGAWCEEDESCVGDDVSVNDFAYCFGVIAGEL